MKTALSLLFVATFALYCSPLCFGQTANSDLEKARKYFPKFQQLLETDPKKAQAPFDQFLKLQDPMQLRLQTWLDTKWIEKRREYERSEPTNRRSSKTSNRQSSVLRENRDLLEEIREIKDETKMKERLKKDGWPALEKLLSATQGNQRASNPSANAEGDNKRARALEQLLAIGNYRYAIRVSRKQSAIKPREELGLPDNDPESAEEAISAAQTIEANRADRAVLEKNEKIKDEIPRSEYEGILELNQWRIAMGLNALLIDPKLCEAARDHSKDMKDHNFFAHESPIEGKKTPWQRAANFDTKASSENIAINGSVAGANKAWFYSPGHHKNMFASGRTYVGLGQHNRHFTQLFR